MRCFNCYTLVTSVVLLFELFVNCLVVGLFVGCLCLVSLRFGYWLVLIVLCAAILGGLRLYLWFSAFLVCLFSICCSVVVVLFVLCVVCGGLVDLILRMGACCLFGFGLLTVWLLTVGLRCFRARCVL